MLLQEWMSSGKRYKTSLQKEEHNLRASTNPSHRACTVRHSCLLTYKEMWGE